MENWNLKTNYQPEVIISKFKKVFDPSKEFLFEKEIQNDVISFKVRKRIMYGWYMAFHNWTVVRGKITSDESSKMSSISVIYKQHFLIWLILSTHLFLGVAFFIAVFSNGMNKISVFFYGSFIFFLGVIFWKMVQKKFKRDVETYQNLISSILEGDF